MSSPEAVAEGVKGPSRFIYFGINPEIGAYVAPSNYGSHSNLDPWPMYVLKQHAMVSEAAGTAYFLTIQVSDGTPPPVDRNANRLANNLGPPMGHPAFLHEFDRKLAPEFILLRVLRTPDGKLAIEGMVKGSEEATAAKPIEKNTYVGVPLAGAGRDHGMADNRPLPSSTTKPAMSNKEIEDKKTIMAHEKGFFGMSL